MGQKNGYDLIIQFFVRNLRYGKTVMSFRIFALLGVVALTSGLSILRSTEQPTPIAGETIEQDSMFEGMGKHTRKISTNSEATQAYFDQALTWAFAFNHDEAIRSLMRAAKQDPSCPMTWWGIAYCEGPNYNSPITPERSKAAFYAIENAKSRIKNASDVERALIEAMAERYTFPAAEDRKPLDQAYAAAMGEVWKAFPQDPDVGTLYAESLMMLRPWELYSTDGQPVEDTDKIVSTLEAVLSLQPDHPGANHLYVHAMEPSLTPERALKAAHALDNLIPASGHLLHMPSHIYVRTGLWDEAIEQNVKALDADQKYLKLSPQQGMQYIYMIHNSHMLAYAAMMSGREKEAMSAARHMWEQTPDAIMTSMGPFFDRWMCSVYDVQKRFGRWDEIIAEPAPPETLLVTTAIWRAHRAIAFAAKKDFANAEIEYTKFRNARAAIPLAVLEMGGMDDRFLEVSDLFIRGEIALQKERWTLATELLTDAAAIESTLAYGEPPQWLQPIRHTLGAVYLATNQYAKAEQCYREDLEKWPNNGWSLFGLSKALTGLGKKKAAQEALANYEKYWAKADAPLTTSCKCLEID
jgi:tetratricopeptide (TPR) repeat protein